MKLSLARIAEFTGAVWHGSSTREGEPETCASQEVLGYSIDSRTIAPGELFFAIRGERLDGHDFVDAALARGAVAAVVARDYVAQPPSPARPLLVVADTLSALQTLARAVRKMWNKPLVAITGSAGKTTTKEAVARLLAVKFGVLKSEANLNNHFGLPLQLLKLDSEHDIAVVELGMNHAGEIAALAAIAEPDIAAVTCVAPVHLGFFDSLAGIARAKYELIEALPRSGTAVLNADDEYVSQFGRDFPGHVITFGIARPADVRGENVRELGVEGSEFDLVWQASEAREAARVRLPLLGRHNVYNALAAAAVALDRGLTVDEAAGALGNLAPSDKRGQVLQVAGAMVINDCYNSNPRALNYVVDALAGMAASGRRIVVAGEMLELGPASGELHRQAGAHMADRGVDIVIGVRGAAREIVAAFREQGLAAEFVETPEAAGEWLAREVRPGDLVLLKASRGVRLEKALETWQRLKP
jgi:UDP-N-acetylmuramoyl-tripeptide--D-alanyl-D-alanine ligase